VVFGELLQSAVVEQVRTAVSHVRDDDPRAVEHRRSERRAHARTTSAPGLGGLDHGGIGLLYGPA
jgi:hypothetical protein